jgi:hypothetical protein
MSDAVARLALTLVRRSQRALGAHLDPSGPDADRTILRLLDILDGPEAQRLARQAEAEGFTRGSAWDEGADPKAPQRRRAEERSAEPTAGDETAVSSIH